jgi:hypothetical protein
MSIRAFVVAGVYCVFVALGGFAGNGMPVSASLVASAEAPASSPPAPQPAGELPVRSTHLERRDAASGLQPALDSIAASDRGPSWVAWTVPAVHQPQRDGHDGNREWREGPNRCVLDEEGRFEHGTQSTGDTTTIVVLVRVAGGFADRVTFADTRCTVEAGTRTVYWMDQVRPAESVSLLARWIGRDGIGSDGAAPSRGAHGAGRSAALAAIALTDDESADRVLEDLVAPARPSSLRRDVAFWLGAARGPKGATVVDRLSRTDPDEAFREHLTFVLTLTGDPGLDRLIDLARHDDAPRVRRQALFWVAQKAGERAVGTLSRAVDDDPDVEVRKSAVFAISQLPKDEGVPKLIALAETHRDREVRKQAMFWLGQTGDPRALTFFERVLGR